MPIVWNPSWVWPATECGIPWHQGSIWLSGPPFPLDSCSRHYIRSDSCSSWKYLSAYPHWSKPVRWIWNHIGCKTRLHPSSCIVLHCHRLHPKSYEDKVYSRTLCMLMTFVQSAADAADCSSSFSESSSVLGMRVSWPKTKQQNLGTGNQPLTGLYSANLQPWTFVTSHLTLLSNVAGIELTTEDQHH